MDVVSEGLSLANKVFVPGATQDDVQENLKKWLWLERLDLGLRWTRSCKIGLSEPLLSTDNQGFTEKKRIFRLFISMKTISHLIPHIPIYDILLI